jgi:hypothetical protein
MQADLRFIVLPVVFDPPTGKIAHKIGDGLGKVSEPIRMRVLHWPIRCFPDNSLGSLLCLRILFSFLSQFILASGGEFLLGYQADFPEQPEPLTQMLTETMG